MASLSDKVTNIISDRLDVRVQQITYDASFVDDLGADSLDLIDLVMAFEEEFNCEIPEKEAEKIKTLGDAVKYFEKTI